jgi:hypothetical protein
MKTIWGTSRQQMQFSGLGILFAMDFFLLSVTNHAAEEGDLVFTPGMRL